MPDSSPGVAVLLERASSGDRTSARELLSLVYAALRASAARHMAAERPGHTLQPTALVNEAYLRLAGQAQTTWDGRGGWPAPWESPTATCGCGWAPARAWLYRDLPDDR